MPPTHTQKGQPVRQDRAHHASCANSMRLAMSQVERPDRHEADAAPDGSKQDIANGKLAGSMVSFLTDHEAYGRS